MAAVHSGRSIDLAHNHHGNPADDPRSSHRPAGRDCLHLRCSSHCFVSVVILMEYDGWARLTTHRSSHPLHDGLVAAPDGVGYCSHNHPVHSLVVDALLDSMHRFLDTVAGRSRHRNRHDEAGPT